jgi:hypothetical protein
MGEHSSVNFTSGVTFKEKIMSSYRHFILTLTLVLLANQAAAAEYGGIRELFIGPSIAYFHWQESVAGQNVLTEQGPIYGVDGTIALDLLKTERAGNLTFRGKIGLFGGVVEYDGQTQEPHNLPVKTDVNYVGVKEEIALGWAVPLGAGHLEPFAVIGYRWWIRDLQDSTANDGGTTVKVSGNTEVWESAYTKVGAALSIPLTKDWRFFVEGGGKYPFYNSNTTDIAGVGNTTVRPEPRWSAFAELGARYRTFRPAVFYEGYRTGQSPQVRISPTSGVYQPKSDEDVVGVSFSYCFR